MADLIEFPPPPRPLSHLGDAIDILENELDNLDRVGRRKVERIIEKLLEIENLIGVQ